jgi:hypothetical protein
VVAAGTSQPPEAPSVGHPQQLPTEREVGEVKTETCPAVSLALCVGSSAAEAADERPPAAKYPRIVESCIASAGPKIVDSIAPVPSVQGGGHSATDSSGDDSDAEVVILTPVTSSSAPLTSAGLHPHPPIGKVSDSMAAVEVSQSESKAKPHPLYLATPLSLFHSFHFDFPHSKPKRSKMLGNFVCAVAFYVEFSHPDPTNFYDYN